MVKIIGRLSAVGIGKETTRGTSVAPTAWVPVQSVDIDDKPDYIHNDSGYGNIAEFNDSDVNWMHAEGGYEGKVFDNVLGLELYAVFGQSPTSAQRATTGVYDHTFSMLNTNQHGSLTVAYKGAPEDVRYAMAMVDEFSIEAVLDKYLTRKVKFMSQASATATNTVAYTLGNEFLARHINIYTAANLAGLSGATAMKATSFKFTVKKNVTIDYVFGKATVDDIVNQQLNVEGEFEAPREDLTLRNLSNNGTAQAIRFEAINTGVTIGTGGLHNPAVRFDFAKAAFLENPRNWDANAEITQTVKFQANYSISDAAIMTARLTNTQTSI